MPASQKAIFFDGLEVTVRPTQDPDPVYFTDQEPRFEVEIHNNDAKYEWSEGSRLSWVALTGSMDEVDQGEIKFGPLDYGESVTKTVQPGILVFEGSGVFGVKAGGARGTDEDGRRRLTSSSGSKLEPCYTYSVWDRSHYEASIERPKQLQMAAVATSVALMLFAAVQIGLAAWPYLSQFI